jgi:uncharacterized protein YbaR (Trm112 family)
VWARTAASPYQTEKQSVTTTRGLSGRVLLIAVAGKSLPVGRKFLPLSNQVGIPVEFGNPSVSLAADWLRPERRARAQNPMDTHRKRQQDMIDKELLDILACPETKEPVRMADQALVDELNARIEKGEVTNRGGEKVEKRMDAGLVREDGKFLYPIEDDIPIMLIDEAIPLEGVAVPS